MNGFHKPSFSHLHFYCISSLPFAPFLPAQNSECACTCARAALGVPQKPSTLYFEEGSITWSCDSLAQLGWLAALSPIDVLTRTEITGIYRHAHLLRYMLATKYSSGLPRKCLDWDVPSPSTSQHHFLISLGIVFPNLSPFFSPLPFFLTEAPSSISEHAQALWAINCALTCFKID